MPDARSFPSTHDGPTHQLTSPTDPLATWCDPSSAAAVAAATAGRYALGEEIARGGMGEVLAASDTVLGREIAVKVLAGRLDGVPAAIARFVAEAKITARLQHPGIPPVHDLGTLPDGRPFLAMKLIRGETLAAFLKGRPHPTADLPRFVEIFEKICQTVGYAHSQGVLHRDLKPANVMVGAFGEVQVMDWGLAKQLRSMEADTWTADASGSGSGLREPDSDPTRSGAVMGTPGYMPPEQARGEVAKLDARADAFGLGAILCEILTGKPPYVGTSGGEVLARAASADLADALVRLDTCAADPELIGLARSCLSADAADRPADGGAVATAVANYRVSVESRLRAAETERAAAVAKAIEQRKRRKVQLALAAALALLLLGGGAGGWWVEKQATERQAEQQRLEAEKLAAQDKLDRDAAAALAQRRAVTERDVTAAVQEALALLDQIKGLPDDPYRWEGLIATAGAAARRAEQAINAGEPTPDLRRRVADLTARVEDADRNRRLLLRFDNVGVRLEFGESTQSIAADYQQAFAEFEIPVLKGNVEDCGRAIARHSQAPVLRAALLDWLARDRIVAHRSRLKAVIQASILDVDPFTAEVLIAPDSPQILAKLARDPATLNLPPRQIELLISASLCCSDSVETNQLLAKAIDRYPTDLRLRLRALPAVSTKLNLMTPAEAAVVSRHLAAAIALRPSAGKLWNALGICLMVTGDGNGALRNIEKAIELDPKNPDGYNALGVLWGRVGDHRKAANSIRKAIALDTDKPLLWCNLAKELDDAKDIPGALDALVQAETHDPTYTDIFVTRSAIFLKAGQYDDAIAAAKRGIELDPKLAYAWYNLGMAQMGKGNLIEGLANVRKATEVDPLFQNPPGTPRKAPQKMK